MADQGQSPTSFGVAGSLSRDCTVYYASDFRSRNIGRFSDLMSAKLREVDADELRIRALLLFSLYESYAAIGKTFRSQTEAPPVSLEIGFDNQQVAIGVTFHWKEGRSPITPGIAQRVTTGVFQTAFDEILGFLRQHSSQLIVKFELTERRIEILTLMNRQDGDRRDPMEVFEIDSVAAPHMEAGQYIEMGDLDYLGLTGEQTLETTLEVTGDLHVVTGAEEVVSAEEAEIFSGEEAVEETSRKITGYEPNDDANDAVSITSHLAEVEALKERIRELESEREFASVLGAAEAGSTPAAHEQKKPDEGWGRSLLKQIWPFAEEDGAEKETTQAISASVAADEGEPVTFAADPQTQDDDAKTLKALSELENIASAKNGSADFQKVVNEIGEDADKAKSKRWIDSLTADLVKEKSRLAELTRDLGRQTRQSELDFKGKERTLQSEVVRLTEQSKRKENQLERNKEMIAQLNMALERSKSTSAALDDQAAKHRLTSAQKLAQTKEDENRALAAKVKSLEDRLIVAQAKSSRPAMDPQMVARLQAAERKVEDLKRTNQRLSDSLAAQKPAVAEKDVMSLRRKLEGMERATQESKKNLEKAQFRIRELQDAERKLQADLQKTLGENRKLRGGRTGESGGQAA